MKKIKLLVLSASLLACISGISGSAYANAYAVATENIKNGFTSALVNGVVQAPSNPYLTFGTPVYCSFSSATLIGPSTGGSLCSPPFSGTPDAPSSNGTGSVPLRPQEDTFVSGGGNTYYSLFGQLGSAYSWGDAIVVREQSATGVPFEARDAAESNTTNSASAALGSAVANGGNNITVSLTVGPSCSVSGVSCTLAFSFQADPYILVALDPLGLLARGDLSLTIKLTGGPTNFSWAPNGIVDTTITGGTEVLDDEDLNHSLLMTSGPPQTFSPLYAADGFGSFYAVTDALAPGNYTLVVSMPEHTEAKQTTVPEPATLALMILGLAGLAFVGHKKKAPISFDYM